MPNSSLPIVSCEQVLASASAPNISSSVAGRSAQCLDERGRVIVEVMTHPPVCGNMVVPVVCGWFLRPQAQKPTTDEDKVALRTVTSGLYARVSATHVG